MTTRYLSLSEMTARLGLRPKSLTDKSGLPSADVMIGSVRGWSRQTVDRWSASRPVAGRRMVDTTNTEE